MRTTVVAVMLLLNACERTCDKPAAGCSCDAGKDIHACDGATGLTCSDGEWKPDDFIICEPGRGVNRN